MALDYTNLSFRCGLEIHQQLEGRKLVCSCPTVIMRDEPDFIVRRELRAPAGETGAVDVAAAHEQKKSKYFLYQCYKDSTCLVELDEEPPHSLNRDALRAALQAAKLLNAEPVDEVRFMRKTVVDGSNTSGFQRTALVAVNGFVEVNGRKIGIPTICLEEEACQVIERSKEYDTYNLSRLGIPLIEIATSPDIESAEECREVAAKLGSILRSVPGLKRGIGTIRQDVNISVKGTARVEIKGFQEYKSIPAVIENEVNRRIDLIRKGKKPEAEVRKAEPDFTTSFLRPMPGAARMYPETDVRPVRADMKIEAVESLEVKAAKLEKLGIGSDLALKAAKSQVADMVLGFAGKFTAVKPAFIAETIISSPATIRRKENREVQLTEAVLESVFEELNEARISKDSVYDILVEYARTKEIDFRKYLLMSGADLEKEVKKIVAANKGLSQNALIGKAMAQLKGKADSRNIIEIINKLR